MGETIAKIEAGIIFILATPLMLFSLVVHFFEKAQMRANSHNDKLFMKRFNLIDRKHVVALIEWNNNYRNDREDR